VIYESLRSGQRKPTVKSFATMPDFKRWVADTELTVDKETKEAVWLTFPDGRYALGYKGYNIICLGGRVLV